MKKLIPFALAAGAAAGYAIYKLKKAHDKKIIDSSFDEIFTGIYVSGAIHILAGRNLCICEWLAVHGNLICTYVLCRRCDDVQKS